MTNKCIMVLQMKKIEKQNETTWKGGGEKDVQE